LNFRKRLKNPQVLMVRVPALRHNPMVSLVLQG
jgi:hypothetical protein